MKMQTKTVRFLVSGKVQGVGFRYNTREEAVRLGLSGWVRNLPDGQVEGVAQGGVEQIGRFLAWLEVGPRFASVTNVATQEIESDTLEHFIITR